MTCPTRAGGSHSTDIDHAAKLGLSIESHHVNPRPPAETRLGHAHCDPTPHRAGHGRPRRVRSHDRPPQRPHRYPGAAAEHAGPTAATRARNDSVDRARGQETTRRRLPAPEPARPRRALAQLATPSPGPCALVPQTCTTEPGLHPGQLANGEGRELARWRWSAVGHGAISDRTVSRRVVLLRGRGAISAPFPAPACQTVHAVLPHTAYRRSSPAAFSVSRPGRVWVVRRFHRG